MQLSDLQYLMHQLGPATPEVNAILQEEVDCWQVMLDGEIGVQLSWQPEPPRVVFSCAVGEVGEALRESIYAHLLVANGLPSERLGLRFALDFPEGQVLVLGELDVPDLSLDSLREQLRIFLQHAVGMSAFIAESTLADEALASSPDRGSSMPSQLV